MAECKCGNEMQPIEKYLHDLYKRWEELCNIAADHTRPDAERLAAFNEVGREMGASEVTSIEDLNADLVNRPRD